MKRGRTALTAQQHVMRAARKFGITRKKKYMDLGNRELNQIGRAAFGSGPNRNVSVLLVPELRKRRSERDPVLLQQQIAQAANTEAGFRKGA